MLNLVLASLTTLLATVSFYLGCPNQQWLEKRPMSFNLSVALSLILTLIAWLLFRQEFSTLSTAFTLMTLIMLMLGVIPLLARFEAPLRTGVNKRAKNLTRSDDKNYQPNWWLNTSTALLLGFPLALSLVGLLAWLGTGGITQSYKAQMVMWLITPLWFTPLALIFFIKKSKRIITLYLLANLVAFAFLWLVRNQIGA